MSKNRYPARGQDARCELPSRPADSPRYAGSHPHNDGHGPLRLNGPLLGVSSPTSESGPCRVGVTLMQVRMLLVGRNRSLRWRAGTQEREGARRSQTGRPLRIAFHWVPGGPETAKVTLRKAAHISRAALADGAEEACTRHSCEFGLLAEQNNPTESAHTVNEP